MHGTVFRKRSTIGTSQHEQKYATIGILEKLELEFFKKFKLEVSGLKPNEVKKEYQLQQWAGIVKEQRESGLTVRQWCSEQGISENAYYYRLHKVRQSMCNALEKAPAAQLAEIPVAPLTDRGMSIRISFSGSTVEISNAGMDAMERVLQVLGNVE